MVLVMVGTQKQQFLRIFNMVENSKILENEEIIAQIGHTKFQSNKIKCFEFIENEKLQQYIKDAELIICHAGVGTIFECLHQNKKVIAVPRLQEFKEHVDNHQLEICEALEKEGYILVCKKDDDFDEILKKSKNYEFKKYQKDESYLKILKNEI